MTVDGPGFGLLNEIVGVAVAINEPLESSRLIFAGLTPPAAIRSSTLIVTTPLLLLAVIPNTSGPVVNPPPNAPALSPMFAEPGVLPLARLLASRTAFGNAHAITPNSDSLDSRPPKRAVTVVDPLPTAPTEATEAPPLASSARKVFAPVPLTTTGLSNVYTIESLSEPIVAEITSGCCVAPPFGAFGRITDSFGLTEFASEAETTAELAMLGGASGPNAPARTAWATVTVPPAQVGSNAIVIVVVPSPPRSATLLHT